MYFSISGATYRPIATHTRNLPSICGMMYNPEKMRQDDEADKKADYHSRVRFQQIHQILRMTAAVAVLVPYGYLLSRTPPHAVQGLFHMVPPFPSTVAMIPMCPPPTPPFQTIKSAG